MTYTPAQMAEAILSIPAGSGFYPSLTVHTTTGATVTATKSANTTGGLSVGSTVKMNVDGVPTEFIVVHQGLPGNMYDASCDGTWLLMKDCYESRAWHSSNVNDYKNSDIHSYLNGSFLGLFDSDMQSAIKQAKIPYVNGTGTTGAVDSGSNGLPAKVFLLAGYEVGWTTADSQHFPIDGAKLDYFVSGNDSTARTKRVAHLNGAASGWWLRSPSANMDTAAWNVVSNGDNGGHYCSETDGIRPALILPSNLIVSGDTVTAEEYVPSEVIELDEIDDGLFWGELTDYGEWAVTAELDGDTSSDTVDVESVENYDLTLEFISPVLSENSLTVISEVSQAGTGANYWSVGDTYPMTLNGKIGDYLTLTNTTLYAFILHFNLPQNGVADNNIIWGCFKNENGVDVALVDSNYNTDPTSGSKSFNMNHWWNTATYGTNYGGWKGTDLRYDILGAVSTQPSQYGSNKTTANVGYNANGTEFSNPKADTLLAAMPSEWRGVLRLWKRYIDSVGNSSNVDANINETIDAISLLTEFEVQGARTYANQYEQNHQVQMAYYAGGNSKVRYRHDDGSSVVRAWCASPRYDNNYNFCNVNINGSATTRSVSDSGGVPAAFKT